MKNQAYNPYLPSWEYIPDGEPHVFGDRVYVYGSHDKFDGELYCMNDYVCWSAPVTDLSDWRFEGVIYRKTDDPMTPLGDHQLYAPDVAQGPDGRFYLYYAYDFLSTMAVAVADSPAGPYRFYGYIHRPGEERLWSQEGDPFLFDPGVLVDDDQRVWLYSGFAPARPLPGALGEDRGRTFLGGYVIELEKDMVTVKGEPEMIFQRAGEAAGTSFHGHEFFEASSMRKIGGRYYFIYSSILGHELCYAVSDRPNGGFVFGGTIISNGDLFLNGYSDDNHAWNYIGNNHGSIVEIQGQWYVFYHRQTNRHQFSRQAMAEAITIKADGSIPQVAMTSCGLNGGPLKGTGVYEARIACHLMSARGTGRYGFGDENRRFDDHPCFTQDGADREDTPNQHIAHLTHGSTAGFRWFDLTRPAALRVTVRGTGNGTMRVRTGLEGPVAASVAVQASGSWTTFSTAETVPVGRQALYFTFEGTGALDFLSFELV